MARHSGTPSHARRPAAAIVPWAVFAAALLLATEPVWRIPLLGFNPTLDELLRIRCLVHE